MADALQASSHKGQEIYSAHIKNAGHWQASYEVQNLIAWRTDVIRWTLIFDHLGWKFDSNSPQEP